VRSLGFEQGVKCTRKIVVRIILGNIDLQADDSKAARPVGDPNRRRDRTAIDADRKRRHAVHDRVLSEENDFPPRAAFRAIGNLGYGPWHWTRVRRGKWTNHTGKLSAHDGQA
jgi:hypothetical protein